MNFEEQLSDVKEGEFEFQDGTTIADTKPAHVVEMNAAEEVV